MADGLQLPTQPQGQGLQPPAPAGGMPDAQTMQLIKQHFPDATDAEIAQVYPQLRAKLAEAGFGHLPDSEIVPLAAHIFDRATSQDPAVQQDNELARRQYLLSASKNGGDLGAAAKDTFMLGSKLPTVGMGVQQGFGPGVNEIHKEFFANPQVAQASGDAQASAINTAAAQDQQSAPQNGSPDQQPAGPGLKMPAAPQPSPDQAPQGASPDVKAPGATPDQPTDIMALAKQYGQSIADAYSKYNAGLKDMEGGHAVSGLGAAIRGIYDPQAIAQNDQYWQLQKQNLLQQTVGAAKDQLEATFKGLEAAAKVQELTQREKLFPVQLENQKLTNEQLTYTVADARRNAVVKVQLDDPNSVMSKALKTTIMPLAKEAGVPPEIMASWSGTAANAWLNAYEPVNKMQAERQKIAIEKFNADTSRMHLGIEQQQIQATERQAAATNALAGATLGLNVQTQAQGEIATHSKAVTEAQAQKDAIIKSLADNDRAMELMTGFKVQNGKYVVDKQGNKQRATDAQGRPIDPVKTGPSLGGENVWSLRRKLPGGGVLDEFDNLVSQGALGNMGENKNVRWTQQEVGMAKGAGIRRDADTVTNIAALKRQREILANKLNTTEGELGTSTSLLDQAHQKLSKSGTLPGDLSQVPAVRGPSAVGAGAGAVATSQSTSSEKQVRMQAPDGTIGTVPASRMSEARAKGYKVIGQ